MNIHILGISSIFMSGVALLAQQLGHTVIGSDQETIPTAESLRKSGMIVREGYEISHFQPTPDLILIDHTLQRGQPIIEHILNTGLPHVSAAQWLAENILKGRHVLAVTGMHGKTLVSSLLAWILTEAGLQPGYLIGGFPLSLSSSVSLGSAPFFIVDASECNAAFFDMRAQFIHYRPRTLIMNNLDYNHAEIFNDLEGIKQQFQHLLQTVPGGGSVIYPADDTALVEVVARGCWTSTQPIAGANGVWQARAKNTDGSRFELWHRDQKLGTVEWSLIGEHNIYNALAAAAAAHNIGVSAKIILAGIKSFSGVRKNLEMKSVVQDISIYEDLAQHPTAIAATLAALRAKIEKQRIIAVVQFASHSMNQGVFRTQLAKSLYLADEIIILRPKLWEVDSLKRELGNRLFIFDDGLGILQHLVAKLQPGDHVIFMSNQNFEGLPSRLSNRLKKQFCVEMI